MTNVTKNSIVYVAAAASAKRAECEPLLRDPGFRKATVPMMMAWAAVEKALTQLSANGQQPDTKPWGLVFGTSHGELEVTKDFLVTFANKGLARPILFQNSLHHSTLGFISLRLGISGPGMTVSNHFFSGEDAVASAMDLIRAGACDIAITVAVDALVTKLDPALGQYYPGGLLKDEGAGCLVLAGEQGLKKLGVPAIAGIRDIACNYTPMDKHLPPALEVFSDYDADALEKICTYLNESENHQTMVLKKPDGTSATIHWEAADAR